MSVMDTHSQEALQALCAFAVECLTSRGVTRGGRRGERRREGGEHRRGEGQGSQGRKREVPPPTCWGSVVE
jgi:hypothetical protein